MVGINLKDSLVVGRTIICNLRSVSSEFAPVTTGPFETTSKIIRFDNYLVRVDRKMHILMVLVEMKFQIKQ
jgi:hypothetical protein